MEGDRPIIVDCMRAVVTIEATEGGGGFRDDWSEDDEERRTFDHYYNENHDEG
jgi:hypothetical protein